MGQHNYHSSITAAVTAGEACAAITDVAGWWATNISGSTQQPGDVFTVRFGKTHATMKVKK